MYFSETKRKFSRLKTDTNGNFIAGPADFDVYAGEFQGELCAQLLHELIAPTQVQHFQQRQTFW